MSRQIGSDIYGVLKGLQMVSSEFLKLQERQVKNIWANSSLRNSIADSDVFPKSIDLQKSLVDIEKFKSELIQRSSMIVVGIRVFASHWQEIKKNDTYKGASSVELRTTDNMLKLTPLSVENLQSQNEKNKSQQLKKSDSLNDVKPKKVPNVPVNTLTAQKSSEFPEKQTLKNKLYEKQRRAITPEVKTNKSHIEYKQSLNATAKQTKVPSSRIGRMISFGSLAAGLGLGTVAEVTRRTLGLQTATDNPFLTPANAERIVSTLCKVRGAALKIGQILSIQDNNIISPTLQQAFERVRQSADFMPSYQVEKVMRNQLGVDWKTKFSEFEMKPFAAASIGQVHYGKSLNGIEVAVKIQYPGVAKGIDSDIENLVAVLNLWNVFPEGMFIDKIVEVAKKELSWEVDYIREALCTKKFKQLLKPYTEYFVPAVIDELSANEVFTTELIKGVPVDKCADLDVESKRHICSLIMNLCLHELFQFRYMQTDPNWSNFFYNQNTRKLILLDFGATRSYDKAFMDKYISVIKAAADGDRKQVLIMSREMGFLTGFESKAMEEAHVDTVMILGEVFSDRNPEFDFARQDTTRRITKLVPTILHHRLCPPPEEIYSLHRKLSGVFLLCAKLGVKMPCRNLFINIYNNYVFD
uniref:ABC1 atypical kinase-like domain-containing protein n=1 Tax=Panstrongylus megistus TaxID=65343 RepID=A0A069DW72_9HEMI